MKSTDLPVPGLLWGNYPERRLTEQTIPDFGLMRVLNVLATYTRRLITRPNVYFIETITAYRQSMLTLSAEQLATELRAVRLELQTKGLRTTPIARAFALISIICEQTKGIHPFPTQFLAAKIVLSRRLAEMATGEGKTYVVAIAAATAALAGIPVHVITANDYLVERDASLMRPLYAALGLHVGTATTGQQTTERRAAYACHITYCTAKELVFDYLRDSLNRNRDYYLQHIDEIEGTTSSKPLLRGLCMAIVDEADSILIDEARVPFVLAQPVNNTQETACLQQSIKIARQLSAAEDFDINVTNRVIHLTPKGQTRVEMLAQKLGSIWHNKLHREEMLTTALAALHLYQCDHHYLVREDKILIIDETTGRVAPGRAWSKGLHQLIELKESCTPTQSQTPATQITYQRFFPRYVLMGGLSGTLSESADELYALYHLNVQQVPLRIPSKRIILPARLFPNHTALWQAVIERITEVRYSGRPVLIGTDSVADSEMLSAQLNALKIKHTVLNARNDEEEAAIVARAGQRAAVTVATNMAGRGTDIAPSKEVIELGGLHVICCQVNASKRIDRQLIGRCARQGNPGSAETWLSIDAPLFQEVLPAAIRHFIAARASTLSSPLVRTLIAITQRYVRARHVLERKRLLEHDKKLDRQLSFGGSVE